LDIGEIKMNNDKFKYRKLAFEIKINYPLINISFDDEDDFLGKFINPTKLFITKSKFGLSAIFTYRRYENLLEFGKGWTFKKDDHNLILDSYINHDWIEIETVLKPYFNDYGFLKVISANVNSLRKIYNEELDSYNDLDAENFGDDLVEIINKYLFKIHSYNILRKDFDLISNDDVRVFGEDIFEATKEISMYIGFFGKLSFFDDEKFKLHREIFGDDLIEMIESRSKHFDYYIRKHFEEYIRDWYLSGDDRALANLT
jgi:hypothetical protein